MSEANITWGSPRMVGELRKLGITVAKSTVEKYRVRSRKPPSPTWKAFLNNHVRDLVSIDFFIVPTVRFKILFVLVILSHHRRRIVHFNVTEHPTAQWTAQQIVEAFAWETAPKYLLGSRWHLRKPVPEAGSKYGDRRSAHCATKPLAECICGACDWQHPARLFGSCHCVERSSFETNPDKLFQLLSLLAYASVVGDG